MKRKSLLKISAISLPLLALTIFTTTSVLAADSNTTASLETKTPIVLTDNQKSVVANAYELRLNGKFDEAKQIMDSANIPRQRMGRHGFMRGNPPKNQEQIRTAILNNDYNKFKELTKDQPNANKIDETSFVKLVEAHKLMEQGKMDEAMVIMKELDLGPGTGKGMGMGRGQGNRMNQGTNNQ